jgi:3-deoxy-D-manno-octulosonate 8-phosphate phosphatase (KDO 8-P phosphatase)
MLKIETLSMVRLVVFDFDGVFTDNSVYVNQDGLESVRCWRSDGIGLERLRAVGVQAFIISTEANPVVSTRAQKLKIPCMQGVEDKAIAIKDTCKKLKIDPKQTMFVGNDINDIPALQLIGIPVGVADAYPEIYPYILYRTQKAGGYGAVREICDLIYKSQFKLKRPKRNKNYT